MHSKMRLVLWVPSGTAERHWGRPRSWGCSRCAAIREVMGGPHLGADALLDLVGRNIGDKPFLMRLERHREGDRHGDLSQRADRRQQIVLRVVAGRGGI